ncbi:cytochrome P450 [Apiospora kogelbergensis]|uniref:cytochrome P450 n=1 Tax=Apiospora kogelbergensis TaxID=1337665 RepID=UPI00312F6775
MESTPIMSLYWVLPILLLVGYTTGTAMSRRLSEARCVFPVVGKPFAFAPRFISNLAFAFNATSLIQQGYEKVFKHEAFQLIRSTGNMIILPHTLLEELSTIPSTIASPYKALEHDLLGAYTGLDLILESRLHHTIVQRKLTPRLGLITPGLQEELAAAFDEELPTSEDWCEFQPYQCIGKIAARLSARAIVGPAFCKDPTWLDISFNYTENLFRTIVFLRMFPPFLHYIVCPLIPAYWKCNYYIRLAKQLLVPRIRELISQNDKGTWAPKSTEEDTNVLHWMIDSVKGRDRDPHVLAHIEVLLALASVHTTLLRMVNVLYDITASNDGLVEELRQEISSVAGDSKGWDVASYDALHKLDSVLRESQRMSPPTTLGLKRFFTEAYTFQDGTRVPKGAYVCLPIQAIENDPEVTPNPEIFDGLRSYRMSKPTLTNQDKNSGKEYLFSSPTPITLNFGYGKSACPGRFFASLIVKMVFVKILTEHDFKFLPATGRPSNLMVHEFLFSSPWQRMLLKKKKYSACPF